jgi:hypothetical protein
MKEINFEEALDIALTQRQLSLATGGKRVRPSRREVEEGFLEAFELVGGISRLAMWANNPANYGDFLKLYAKMIPKEVAEDAGQTFIYQSNVPPSALNKPAELTRIDDDLTSVE